MERCSSKSTEPTFRPVRRLTALIALALALLLVAPLSPAAPPSFGGACLAAQEEGGQDDEGMDCNTIVDKYWYLLCAKVTITCVGEGIEIVVVLDRVCEWERGKWRERAVALGIPIEALGF